MNTISDDHGLVQRPIFRAIVALNKLHGFAIAPALIDGSKRPSDGYRRFTDRRPTEEEEAGWLKRFPHANGIIITGGIYGFFVCDTDDEKAEAWTIQQGMPTTPIVATRRGFHRYLRKPDFPVRQWIGKVHTHVDIKGDGNYVIEPGSIGKDNFIYKWLPGLTPADVAFADPPDWLYQLLYDREHPVRSHAAAPTQSYSGSASPRAKAALEGESAAVRNAGAGCRNDTLSKSAFNLGQLVGAGELSRSEARDALASAAEPFDTDDQWRRKTIDTIDRGLERGALVPRPPSYSTQENTHHERR